ncbi:MAG: NFACT family protein [Candidatus Nanoarchaeia archaeon]
MKSETASFELKFLVDEMQSLIAGKIDQIYQQGKDFLLFQIHIPNKGKVWLRVIPGKILFLSSVKGITPEKPPGFCVYLRKYLKGGRIRAITQKGFERIVEIVVETKEQKYLLVFELFSRGNMVVCDKDYMVFSALEKQDVGNRVVRAKHRYEFPDAPTDFFTIKEDELKELLAKSEKDTVVKAIAVDLRLGGVYAEEICQRSDVDGDKSPEALEKEEIKSLFEAVVSLREENPQPRQVWKGDSLVDIVPVYLKHYENLESKGFSTFNEALDAFLSAHEQEKHETSVKKEASTKLDKVSRMIEEQSKRLRGLEKSRAENQRKGELIFENYSALDGILKEVRRLIKSNSLEGVEEILKNTAAIKSIDKKKREIVVEVGE